jgi:ABC-type lipoprotein release transport system permease subunit
VAALAVGRLLSSLLFQVTPRDPLALTISGLVLALVSCAACLLPAQSASRTDPVEALRGE